MSYQIPPPRSLSEERATQVLRAIREKIELELQRKLLLAFGFPQLNKDDLSDYVKRNTIKIQRGDVVEWWHVKSDRCEWMFNTLPAIEITTEKIENNIQVSGRFFVDIN